MATDPSVLLVPVQKHQTILEIFLIFFFLPPQIFQLKELRPHQLTAQPLPFSASNGKPHVWPAYFLLPLRAPASSYWLHVISVLALSCCIHCLRLCPCRQLGEQQDYSSAVKNMIHVRSKSDIFSSCLEAGHASRICDITNWVGRVRHMFSSKNWYLYLTFWDLSFCLVSIFVSPSLAYPNKYNNYLYRK